MTLANKQPDNFQRTINNYVPGLKYVADVVHGGTFRVSLGPSTVAAASGAVILAALTDLATATTFTTLLDYVADAYYGRNVTVTGTAGTDTGVVTIVGRDYLGQPMKENIVAGDNAATVGKKAFKWIDAVTVATVDATETFSVGWGTAFGLPYKTVKVLSEEADGVVDGTLAVLTAPVLTDPQTITTGDPRGTVVPHTTPDASTDITVTLVLDNSVNSSGHGGLHGIAQFYA